MYEDTTLMMTLACDSIFVKNSTKKKIENFAVTTLTYIYAFT